MAVSIGGLFISAIDNISLLSIIKESINLLNNTVAIKNSIQTFCLNDIYKSHKDYVIELVKKAKIYNDEQLDEYLKNFKELFSGKEEMQRILYGNYLRNEDAGKRPLVKLTRDILIDLGISIDD